MTPIFEGQPPQNKAFSNQKKGHSRLGIHTAWAFLEKQISHAYGINPTNHPKSRNFGRSYVSKKITTHP